MHHVQCPYFVAADRPSFIASCSLPLANFTAANVSCTLCSQSADVLEQTDSVGFSFRRDFPASENFSSPGSAGWEQVSK